MGRDNAVCIATRNKLDGPEFELRWVKRFSLFYTRPEQLRTHVASSTRVLVFFAGVRRPGRDVEHPTPSRTELRMGRNTLLLPLYDFMAC
jgi:hypothetical protein